KDQGLVIALDTCEILPPALEEYLRDQLICPAVDQTNGLICIITGRHNQNLRRVVDDPIGHPRELMGYADRLTNPPPVVWNLSQFSAPDIKDYAIASDLNPTPELINYLQQTARGVPFAIQLLVDAIKALGPEQVRNEFPPASNTVELAATLQVVVQRFLRYC